MSQPNAALVKSPSTSFISIRTADALPRDISNESSTTDNLSARRRLAQKQLLKFRRFRYRSQDDSTTASMSQTATSAVGFFKAREEEFTGADDELTDSDLDDEKEVLLKTYQFRKHTAMNHHSSDRLITEESEAPETSARHRQKEEEDKIKDEEKEKD